MEYKKSMYLLSLLFSSAGDEKREKLGELFSQTVKKTESFQKLMKLLQTVTFIGYDGIAQKNESAAVLENAVVDIQNATQNIKKMDLLIKQISQEVNQSAELLSSPRFFDEDITAVLAEDVDTYNKFYKALANSICYYMISQFGVKSIRNLTFNHRASFQDIVKLINQQYANELSMTSGNPKLEPWAIVKTTFSGDNLIEYDGFKIEYSNVPLSEMLRKVSVGEYARVAPYLFAATSSAVEASYIGIGNIVGVDAMNGLSILDSEIITDLPVSAFGERNVELLNPIGEIENSLHSDCFCVSPEDFVSALNRWSLNKTVTARKYNHQCIICGEKIGYGRTTCNKHFSLNR